MTSIIEWIITQPTPLAQARAQESSV